MVTLTENNVNKTSDLMAAKKRTSKVQVLLEQQRENMDIETLLSELY